MNVIKKMINKIKYKNPWDQFYKKDERDMDRLEHEKMSFHLKVYEGYLTIADLFKDRVVVVNGEQSKQEVLDTVKNVLYPFIKERMG